MGFFFASRFRISPAGLRARLTLNAVRIRCFVVAYRTQLLKTAKDKKKRRTAGKRKGGERQQQHQRPGNNEEEEEGVEWTTKGIPNFAQTSAHARRHRRPTVGDVSLSESALEKMPSLDDFIGALDPKTGRFPLEMIALTCFDMNFPLEAVKLFVDKVGLGLPPFFSRAAFVALGGDTYRTISYRMARPMVNALHSGSQFDPAPSHVAHASQVLRLSTSFPVLLLLLLLLLVIFFYVIL